MEKDKEQIVETAVEARGGFLGRPVLLVLLVSVARQDLKKSVSNVGNVGLMRSLIGAPVFTKPYHRVSVLKLLNKLEADAE